LESTEGAELVSDIVLKPMKTRQAYAIPSFHLCALVANNFVPFI